MLPDDLTDDDIRAHIDQMQADDIAAAAMREFGRGRAHRSLERADLESAVQALPAPGAAAADVLGGLGTAPPAAPAGTMAPRMGAPSGEDIKPPLAQVAPATPNAENIQQAVQMLQARGADPSSASLLGEPGPVQAMPPSGRTSTTTHTRTVSTNPYGAPPAVSDNQKMDAMIAEAEDQAINSRAQHGMARALGMLGMAIAQSQAGPLGLPNAELLYKMLPQDEGSTPEDARVMALRQQQQRGAQQRTEQEQWTRQQQDERDKEARRQAAAHNEGALDRANRLRIAQLGQEGASGRTAQRGENAMRLEQQRAADQLANWQAEHPGRGGHGGGGVSRDAAIESYVAQMAETYETNTQQPATDEQRAQWRTQAEGIATPTLTHRNISTHEPRVGARPTRGEGSAAAQAADSLAARQDQQHAAAGQRTAAALQRAGIPELESSLGATEHLLSGVNDSDITLALSAVNHPAIMSGLSATGHDRAAALAMKLASVQNVLLHARSGSAVVDNELRRIGAELGTAGWSPSLLRQGMAQVRAALNAQRQNLTQGQPAAANDDLSDLGGTEVR